MSKRLVVDGFGKFVGKKENQITVKERGTTLISEPAENLRQIVITGKTSISSDAINLLSENGVDLIVLNWKGKVVSQLSSPMMRTVKTRKDQYFANLDKRSGHIAKNFIFGKMKNQYALLGTWAKNRKETEPNIADKLISLRNGIQNQISKLENVQDDLIENIRQNLFNIEAVSSSIYWNGFSHLVPQEFNFQSRHAQKDSPRDATDLINSILNYGYAILEGDILRAIYFAGLDPYGGFLHVDRPGKASLVYDLMEEFRQQIVDRTIIHLISKKQIDTNAFEIVDGVCKINDEPKKLIISTLLEKLESHINYKDRKIKWCDLMIEQARNLAKYLRKEVSNYEPFFLRW